MLSAHTGTLAPQIFVSRRKCAFLDSSLLGTTSTYHYLYVLRTTTDLVHRSSFSSLSICQMYPVVYMSTPGANR